MLRCSDKFIQFASLASAFLLTSFVTGDAKNKHNVADSSKHPYADPKGGRENHRLTDASCNQFRIYDFYQRQADYYLKHPDKLPEIIPAFPGLDGGKYGHWGKFNQNGHKDNRWNEMGLGNIVGQQVPGVGPDSIALNLNPEEQLSAVFTPSTFNIRRYWKAGFVHFNPYRWGTSGGAAIKGTPQFKTNKGWSGMPGTAKYMGYYHHGDLAVFHYLIGETPVYDMVSALKTQSIYKRTIILPKGSKGGKLALFDCKNSPMTALSKGYLMKGQSGDNKAKNADWITKMIQTKGGGAKLSTDSGSLSIEFPASDKELKVAVYFTRSHDASAVEKAIRSDRNHPRLADILKGNSKQRWKAFPATSGTLASDTKAYVVDDIPLPFKNDNKSLMFLTSIDFDKQGAAYISTLMGEIWKVTGLNKQLNQVVWKKIATGLNQPFGLKIWEGKIHVLEREQLTVLEDINGDGEIDFYRNFSNHFRGLNGSHTHTFGLGRDAQKNIYCIGAWDCWKISPDGNKAEKIASGFRNCMGLEVLSDGTVLAGPQEGTNTPTSSIIAVNQGEKYGFNTKGHIDAPMCYVPRGIDNSTGGFLETNSKNWGPLGKQGLIGLCYGSGTWYNILRSPRLSPTDRLQAATVPMDGDFTSGVTRGAINPVDGQVYTVGLDGWGDYATADGCFHRIRYTGKPLYKAIGYQTYDNGIRIDFPVELDSETCSQTNHYFAQMWDYRNTKQYGSPEFSVLHPEQLGHDPLPVTSARLLPNKKSIFIEIPALQPSMQTHIRMHLKAKDGHSFKTDIFPTIIHLGPAYPFDGAQPVVKDKNRQFVLKGNHQVTESKDTVSGKVDAHARKVIIQTIPGLKYHITEFKAKAGESLALVLENKDSMPHNLLIVKPGTYKKVGTEAFKMLNDPNALKKHYVPDNKSDVLMFTYVIEPKRKHTTYFTAPEKPGTYPFMCTFPGHWQIMKGVMIVE